MQKGLARFCNVCDAFVNSALLIGHIRVLFTRGWNTALVPFFKFNGFLIR